MDVRKQSTNVYLVNLDEKEVESLKEQAGRENKPTEDVFHDIVNTGWTTCFSDD